MKKTTVLTVIDGLGLRGDKVGNAFEAAKTPNIDFFLQEYPNTILHASGPHVGLPKGQIGNSEVGHLNIGAGQIVYTGLSLINNQIETGQFEKNQAFQNVFKHVKKNNSTLHVMGLLSDGGVHSLQKHLFQLLDVINNNEIKKVVVHIFGDGRDVAPKSILSSIEKLNIQINKYNYLIGSISGRFFSMDRDTNFDRIQKSYDMLLNQNAPKTFENAINYVNSQYQKDITDEFLIPAVNTNYSGIKDNDGILFFNFRPDRARELSHYLIGSKLYKIEPKKKLKNICLVSMMKYEGIEKALVAFESMVVPDTIGSVLAQNKLKQLRIAETQKYAHVTFFMDGGKDIIYDNSKRIMIPSKKVISYASAPKMSAEEITDTLITELPNYDVVIMNYANPDMVGHTGDFKAAIVAVETLDKCLGKLWKAVEQNGGTVFITADHGNAETMLDENNQPATKHTTSPVFLICSDKTVQLKPGSLANVTPTVLDYLNLKKPKSMTKASLIIKTNQQG